MYSRETLSSWTAFFPSLCPSLPHGRHQTFAVGARLSLSVSMTTPSAEGKMRGHMPGFKEIDMLPLSFTLCWSVAAWHEGHPQAHWAKGVARCAPSLLPAASTLRRLLRALSFFYSEFYNTLKSYSYSGRGYLVLILIVLNQRNNSALGKNRHLQKTFVRVHSTGTAALRTL